MWIMTTRGFYSVVEHRDDPSHVLVRARARQDIENLADLISAKPWFDSKSDYPWRCRCTKKAWTKALEAMSKEITYDNFKSAVGKVSRKHAWVYHKVWGDLFDLEDGLTEAPESGTLER